MKKTLLLVLIAGTLFASSNRVNVMGGAGFWGDDYSSMTVYPANVNNHNVAWMDNDADGNNFTAVWGDGTKFGFGATNNANDVVNMWFGTGNMGFNFGLNMSPAVDAVTCADDAVDCVAVTAVDAETAVDFHGGYNMDGVGNIGVHYNMGSGDMGFNFGRAQDVWLWDNMSVGFMMMGETSDGADNGYMMFDCDFWKVNDWGGTQGLFGMGVGYNDMSDDGSMMLTWTFGAETMLNDWAAFRVGYVQSYDFIAGAGDAGVPSMGLGFNYGGFTLDMTLADYSAMLNNPVSYITGYNDAALGSGFTISYNW